MALSVTIVRFDSSDVEEMTVEPGWNWSFLDAPENWMGPLSGGPFRCLRDLFTDIQDVFGEEAI